MKTIRVAIIGQGRSGKNIHGNYFGSGQDKYKVVAVVDNYEHMRDAAKEKFECDVYDDYKKLLDRKDIDLVVNSSYSYMHVPISKEFLDKGFNVLCEKPLTKKVADVDMLIEAAKKSGATFAIFQQSRFASYYRKMMEVIESGVLGEIKQISGTWRGFRRRWDWQTLQEYYGGELMNTTPHPLDQMLAFFGFETKPNVFSRLEKRLTSGDAEDYIKIILSADNKPLIDLEVSNCCFYNENLYMVQGLNGTMCVKSNSAEWTYYIPEDEEERPVITESLHKDGGMPRYCKEDLKLHKESWKDEGEEYGVFGGMTGDFYEMLYKTLANGEPLEVTPMQVRRQIEVIEECHKQNPHIYK